MDKEKFIENLQTIHWFANCGKGCTLSEFPITIQPIYSIDDCKESISSLGWENTTLEARNRLTIFLHKNNMDDYRQWNKVTDYYKENFDQLTKVIKEYANINGFGKEVIDDISWNILGAAMENHYLSVNKKIPIFFKYMMDVYAAGHIPCGWIGEVEENYKGAPIDFSKGILKVY